MLTITCTIKDENCSLTQLLEFNVIQWPVVSCEGITHLPCPLRGNFEQDLNTCPDLLTIQNIVIQAKFFVRSPIRCMLKPLKQDILTNIQIS